MPKTLFFRNLQQEVSRIDAAKVSKRFERVIEGYTDDRFPKAVIAGKQYSIFNSNDYLGLRHDKTLKKAEHQASMQFGTGPGAVRFISGSLSIHRDLEKALAKFHGRDDAMVFSSAFAANMAVIFSLAKGQSKDSLISNNTLVISDELNHRSIIDGIRIAGLSSEQKQVFPHLKPAAVANLLKQNAGKFDRVLIVTDGVFSMLGELQDLKTLASVCAEHDELYEQGVLLIVDDAHGVAACGETGRGTEEVTSARADVLVGTLGKGFGADGGYVVGDQIVIDYLREAAATYIYSNSISPGTAGAALTAVQLVDGAEGKKLLKHMRSLIAHFKEAIQSAGFTLAADSHHPIQPILIADPVKSQAFMQSMYDHGFIVTSINYPVVPKGKDEIRVQLNAQQTIEDIDNFITTAKKVAAEIGIV
ncbi:aminotransferase class I/II-fold pyridoxal phosphate-dependent enzyme [Candidatus Woesebacteria bacterium]|nr:aminotransferase class I/II-fold pyridoxal phosphate-dependent enzyme [Candidatus Woesebacteria bacterium]